MTATNHALTGAFIGLAIGQPLIALPAALASHFICDVIPHFRANDSEDLLMSKFFRNYLVIDASLCVLLVMILAVLQPANWLLAAGCAFVATAPDLAWINKYISTLRGKHWRPSRYSQFAKRIQWFEKPIGAVVEVVWFVAMIILILPFLH